MLKLVMSTTGHETDRLEAVCEECGYVCGPWSSAEDALWRFSHTGRVLCLNGEPSCYDMGVVLEEAFGMAEIDLSDPMISIW